MYGNIGRALKTFTIQAKEASSVSGRGRVTSNFDAEETGTLKAYIGNSTDRDIERFKQKQKPITHTLVQKGRKKAGEGDILMLGDQKYYVQAVENPGGITSGIGCYTVYQVEERTDK